jgi:hypothetical protein
LARRIFGIAGTVLALLAADVAARAGSGEEIPNFSSVKYGWITFDDELKPMTMGPKPVRNDPNYPYFGNQSGTQPTFRIADLSNPILTGWSRAIMKKANDDVIAGHYPYFFQAYCMPGGVPGQLLGIFEPVYWVQTEKEVLMIWQRDHTVRHIYMNVPHSKDVKPSWYGESVGHYENGDTLVVDTIGLSEKAPIDNWRTPHSDKLHVTERFKLTNGGYSMQAIVTLEDPIALTEPLTVYQQWDRDEHAMIESICAEGTNSYYGEGAGSVPTAGKADF